MRNDINAIKNELIEQSNNARQEKEKQKQREKLSNLKTEIKGTIKAFFANNDVFSHNELTKIYKQREKIIDDFTSIFYEMAETKPVSNDWIKEHRNCTKKEEKLFFAGKLTEKIKVYDFPSDDIKALVKDEFLKQYKQCKIELKEEHLILKEELKQKLIKELKDGIDYCINDDCLPYYVFIIFRQDETKETAINNITSDEAEQTILNEIYYQTLNEVKKGYDISQRKTTKTTKLALPWKIIGFTKAFKTIWKM